MDLNNLEAITKIVNPWVESVVLFIMFIILVIVASKLLSNITDKLLKYFSNNEYSFLPEIIQYTVYLLGIVLLLIYSGIFKFALIIITLIILFFSVIALYLSIIMIIPDYIAGKKLKKLNLRSSYGKKPLLGLLNTKYIINDKEVLIIPNKKLFDNLQRSFR